MNFPGASDYQIKLLVQGLSREIRYHNIETGPVALSSSNFFSFAVLVLKRLQPLSVENLQPAVLGLPFVERRARACGLRSSDLVARALIIVRALQANSS
jgi:hypothetical protein